MRPLAQLFGCGSKPARPRIRVYLLSTCPATLYTIALRMFLVSKGGGAAFETQTEQRFCLPVSRYRPPISRQGFVASRLTII